MVLWMMSVQRFGLCFILVLMDIHFVFVRCLWHPYDENKVYPRTCYDNDTNTLLPKYQRSQWASRPMSLEFMQKYKLWPDLISQFDLVHGETMFGLEEAIEAVYKHQHPADCSKAKFLISGMYESGFGSELHVIGVGLATAMNLNRVYIMNPHRKMDSMNHWQVDVPFCHKQGKDKLNLDCYYEPWTNCTIHDALDSRSIQDLRVNNLHPTGHNKEVYSEKYINEKTIIEELGPNFGWDLPKPLDLLMSCGPFPKNKVKYWWRAVSVAYLMRINEPTKQLIRHFKYNESSSMYFDKEKEQCVSVYARRGDKHLEMYILKNETIFFETAKELWNKMQPRLDPNQARPVMFVASEDATVIESAIEWGRRNNWKILYTDLFDRRKHNAGGSMVVRKPHLEATKDVQNNHHELEYFSMILNMDSHIQCTSYICSMPSNFCRLIDELKATVAAKANTPLVEGKPCYTGRCIKQI